MADTGRVRESTTTKAILWNINECRSNERRG
jgi:hypothetical protein